MRLASKIAGATAVLAFAFCLGFTWKDIRTGNAPSGDAFSRLMTGRIDSGTTPTELFHDNYNIILAHYHKAVDPSELKYAGMQGLFASLGDPPTMFLPPQEAEDFQIETKGNYAGIGARLGNDPLGAKVDSVFKDGPAEKAGMKAGDIISRIGSTDVSGKRTDEIVDLVRGGEGTPVSIYVLRLGEPQFVKLNVVRAKVIVPTVDGKMITDSRVGFIKVDQFSETTAPQFDKVLFELLAQQPRGLVVDLRGNPGGLLDTAVAMLERFLEGKIVVTMQHKGGGKEETSTRRGRSAGYTGPVVILMNKDSASASEIFAGVMRDYNRGTIVGEHSYGKSSVQGVILLKDMSTAKLTIARYFLPGGENFSRKVDEDGIYMSGGLKPNFAVELVRGVRPEMGNPKTDAQLAKAIEVINSKVGA